ncbi:MAG: 50S ribosomal protein L11 methyltransferase [Bacteroidales bacterium]
MKQTIELQCIIHAPKDQKQEISDILTAQLSLIGYTGFLDTPEGLNAYIPQESFDYPEVKYLSVVQMFNEQIEFRHKIIKEKNWNESWEKSFKPVTVGKKCIIRAPFHEPEKNFQFDIIIEPKMSFGTGHHATTYLMINTILNLEIENKKILDIGCGTGILAILADKMKAKEILAIDKNEWAYKNTLENININNAKNISCQLGTLEKIKNRSFDIILANINKNVLLNDLPRYGDILNKSGKLILSGIYVNDLEEICQKASLSELQYKNHMETNEWVAVEFEKN